MFRYAPAYPRHTLPEGFFLQVFLSVLALILGFVGYVSETVETIIDLIFMYITYRQLFGYGRWGTLWRLVVVELSQMAVVAIFVATVIVYLYEENDRDTMIIAFQIILASVIVLTTVMLYVTHIINKRTFNRELMGS